MCFSLQDTCFYRRRVKNHPEHRRPQERVRALRYHEFRWRWRQADEMTSRWTSRLCSSTTSSDGDDDRRTKWQAGEPLACAPVPRVQMEMTTGGRNDKQVNLSPVLQYHEFRWRWRQVDEMTSRWTSRLCSSTTSSDGDDDRWTKWQAGEPLACAPVPRVQMEMTTGGRNDKQVNLSPVLQYLEFRWRWWQVDEMTSRWTSRLCSSTTSSDGDDDRWTKWQAGEPLACAPVPRVQMEMTTGGRNDKQVNLSPVLQYHEFRWRWRQVDEMTSRWTSRLCSSTSSSDGDDDRWTKWQAGEPLACAPVPRVQMEMTTGGRNDKQVNLSPVLQYHEFRWRWWQVDEMTSRWTSRLCSSTSSSDGDDDRWMKWQAGEPLACAPVPRVQMEMMTGGWNDKQVNLSPVLQYHEFRWRWRQVDEMTSRWTSRLCSSTSSSDEDDDRWMKWQAGEPLACAPVPRVQMEMTTGGWNDKQVNLSPVLQYLEFRWRWRQVDEMTSRWTSRLCSSTSRSDQSQTEDFYFLSGIHVWILRAQILFITVQRIKPLIRFKTRLFKAWILKQCLA